MVHIKVWEFGNGYWRQVFTSDHIETKDECKYFRVISNGHKEFYKNPQDYKIHHSIKKIVTVNGTEY